MKDLNGWCTCGREQKGLCTCGIIPSDNTLMNEFCNQYNDSVWVKDFQDKYHKDNDFETADIINKWIFKKPLKRARLEKMSTHNLLRYYRSVRKDYYVISAEESIAYCNSEEGLAFTVKMLKSHLDEIKSFLDKRENV